MAMIQKQKGVGLIVSLVFLIALTAVASALMLNTTTDIKMSGASEEKLVASQAAISAVDETIANQVTGANNLFAQQVFPQVINPAGSVTVTNITITNRNNNILLPECPHTRLASSNDLFKCNILAIAVNNNYGKQNTSNVNVNAGVTQQVLNIGN